MRYHRLILSSVFSLSLSAPAFAAEPGTYRPGAPYYSTQAGSADICERQCSGDAQCKGWNYVTITPAQTNGVCEFNSADAAPVPSDISTSGSNGVTRYSRRISAGGTNTVRVGAPSEAPKVSRPNVVAARTAQSQTPTPLSAVRPGARAVRPGQALPARRVVREPVPSQIQPGQSDYRAPSRSVVRPAQPQVPQRPRFQHNLDPGVPQGYAPRTAPQAPRPQPQQPQYIPRPANQVQPMAPQPRLQGGDPRLQNMVRQRAAQPMRANPPAVPRPQAQAAPPIPQMQTPQARPQTLAQAEQSLFGSLHDDVKAPKPMTPAEMGNPDAPIATVSAVPVKKVTTENLMGLAGAPSR